MKRRLFSWITAVLFMILPSCTSNKPDVLSVLVITGGHGFEREAFFEMFDKMDGVEYIEMVHPEANAIYGSEEVRQYDVLVFYDMVQEITSDQKEAFLTLIGSGKGMVFLHHSLASYQEWDMFHTVLGGKYVLPDKLPPQDSLLASDYRHDEEVNVMMVDHQHPVTMGLNDFTLLDEVYINYNIGDQVTPLLKTDHPRSPVLIGWANEYKKGRVVYLQPGHDHHAFEDEHYVLLIKQAMEWVRND